MIVLNSTSAYGGYENKKLRLTMKKLIIGTLTKNNITGTLPSNLRINDLLTIFITCNRINQGYINAPSDIKQILYQPLNIDRIEIIQYLSNEDECHYWPFDLETLNDIDLMREYVRVSKETTFL